MTVSLILIGANAAAAAFFFLGMWVERCINIARQEFSKWEPS